MQSGSTHSHDFAPRLAGHLDSSPLAAIEWSPEFQLIHWSKGAERIFGWSAEEVVGKHWGDWALVYEEDIPHVERVTAETLTTGHSVSENRNYTADGRVIECSWFNSVLFEGNGEVRSIFSFIEDVTEKKARERALRDSQERLDLALRGAELSLWEWELSTDEVRLIRGLDALGFPVDSLPRTMEDWQSRIDPNQAKTVSDAMSRHLEGLTPFFEFEARVHLGGNLWKWMFARGHACEVSPSGKPIRVMGTYLDVTKSKGLQAQLWQAQRFESIGLLAGGIAHDFNNLLLGILAHAEFARDAIQQDEDPIEDLEMIECTARRATDLTSQLLTMTRQKAPKVQSLDLVEHVEHLLKTLRRMLPPDIQVDFSAGRSLPRVQADPVMLDQVLLNLFVNAKDSIRDTGWIRVETDRVSFSSGFVQEHAWAKPGSFLRLRITDNGRGMSSDVRSRIFDPFFTTKQNGKGSGLGLSVARGIIEAHSGMFHVESEPGKGSCFEVYLPVQEHEHNPDDHSEQPLDLRGQATILVAEDEELVRNLVLRILNNAGYEVLVARDGRETLGIFKEKGQDIDLVILDVVMPHKNGREVYEELRSLDPEIRVLFSSGYSAITLPEEVQAQAPMLSKPYGAEDLLLAVHSLLEA